MSSRAWYRCKLFTASHERAARDLRLIEEQGATARTFLNPFAGDRSLEIGVESSRTRGTRIPV